MQDVIFFKQRTGASWFALALGFVGACAIVIMGGKNVAAGLGIVAAVGVVAFGLIVLSARLLTRGQLTSLTLRDGALEAEPFALFGKAPTLVFHASETSGWRWKSKPASGAKDGTLAFTYAGRDYFMPFKNAQVKKFKAFEELAPFILWA